MSGPGFVHLHVHSSYSLLEGALPIARLAELAKADRQPALALTDSDNMFGALEFSEKLAGYGIQPIVGCALAVDFADHETAPRSGAPLALPRLVLIAAREEGYRNLMRLTSRAFLDVPPGSPPHLRLETLAGEQSQIDWAAQSAEQRLASAQRNRMNDQAIFVDETGGNEALSEPSAAMRKDEFARLLSSHDPAVMKQLANDLAKPVATLKYPGELPA